jgi:hypothetical protein
MPKADPSRSGARDDSMGRGCSWRRARGAAVGFNVAPGSLARHPSSVSGRANVRYPRPASVWYNGGTVPT